MYNILFVINGLTFGGVPSSLSSLYSLIKNDFKIDVLPLSWVGNKDYNFQEAVLPIIPLLSAYTTKPKYFQGIEWCWVVALKVIKKLSKCFGIDIEPILYKKVIKQIESQKKYDIIISFQDHVTAVFCQHFKYSPKIAWIHCDYSRLLSNSNDSQLFEHFQKIVCVSNFTANEFCKSFPNVKGKVRTIYNVLDGDRIMTLGSQPLSDPRFNFNKFTIISIGRLSPEKCFYEIPRIANELQKFGLDFNWYIIGGGVNIEMKKITDNISYYNVSNHVIPLGSKSNPYPYLKQSDLLVSLSSTEACPMVFNEARILQVPIVSTNFSSSYEFIDDSVNGLISPLNKLHEVISKMIVDHEFYQSIKRNASHSIISNSDIQNKIHRLFVNVSNDFVKKSN